MTPLSLHNFSDISKRPKYAQFRDFRCRVVNPPMIPRKRLYEAERGLCEAICRGVEPNLRVGMSTLDVSRGNYMAYEDRKNYAETSTPVRKSKRAMARSLTI